MVIKNISGRDIYYAFIAGTNKVVHFREELNRINVFPVKDSDTGNNLSSTLTYIAEIVSPEDSPKETMKLIADASLSGARGNSGIIFAQFINGLSQEVSDEKIGNKIFAKMIRSAVPHAYKAVSKPIEGTILTVIKEWSDAVDKYTNESEDFSYVFNKSLSAAKISLHNTTEKLQVLKDAKVVDAGALGFVHFLEGISDYIANAKDEKILHRKEENTLIEETSTLTEITYRYCCEALLIGKDIDQEKIKTELEDFGDSLVVAGNQDKVKVHMHSNNPPELFLFLRKYGKISQQKVDDMVMEQEIENNRKHKIALVTDSIADIPREFVEENQIHVIPLNIDIDGSIFLDKVAINNEILFSIIDEAKIFPTSSQPSIKLVKEKLDYLKEKYDSIIILSVSKELSGTWNVFTNCAEDLKKEGYKISVVDSCLNSGAEGLLVMAGADMIKNDDDHEKIVEELEKIKKNTKIFVSVSDFNFMVRGGRVSPLKGKVAKVLNLKPIISLDEKGKGYSFSNALSQKGNMKKIKKIVREMQEKGNIEQYGIVHGHVPEKAEEYRKVFSELIGKEPEFIQEISSIVALSAGRGAIAICLRY